MNLSLSNEDPRISPTLQAIYSHTVRASMNWNEDVIALIASCDELYLLHTCRFSGAKLDPRDVAKSSVDP